MNISDIEKKLQALEPKELPLDLLDKGKKTIAKEQMLLLYSRCSNYCKIAAIITLVAITFWNQSQYEKILTLQGIDNEKQNFNVWKSRNMQPFYSKK